MGVLPTIRPEIQEQDMSRRRKRNGYTLIEVLIAGLIMTLLGLGLWTLLRSSYDSQYEILGQNSANSYARQAVDTLADNLRGATGLTSATANDITFTNAGGSSIRYWVSGGNLVTTTGGSPSGGTVVAMSVTSVSFVYWTYSGGAWSSSTAPGTPANVGAVDFTASSTVNGATRAVSGSVRIRMK